MKTKLFLSAVIVLALAGVLIGKAGVAHAEAICDSAFVSQMDGVITVQPTGISDTSNLQCAFDLAAAIGPGVNVRLLTGTYRTAQVFANDFHGSFTGAGMGNTVITNLPNLYVTPNDCVLALPSAENPWAALISFIEGNVVVTDMAMHIQGAEPTQEWTIFGMVPGFKLISNGFWVGGDESDARFERVLVEGEPAPDSVFGVNLINGITYLNYFGGPGVTGSFVVKDSILRNVASGTPTAGTSSASILITRNVFENVLYGLDAMNFSDSRFEFSYNKVNAFMGIDLYDAYGFPGATGSEFLIKNNVFQGVIGPFLELNFASGNKCLLVGNNVQNVTDVGIYLGPGTTGCTVVGGSNKTNVLDLGTGNVLVGVNNMGTGVGPRIQTLLKMFK